MRAAKAPTRQAITQGARDARWQKYVDRVKVIMPELTDEADIIRRAGLLRQADMCDLSRKAARARKLKAELRALERELDATGLLDAGA